MRIGLIVDGQSEFWSLRDLLGRLETPHTFIGTLHSNMQPHAPIAQIVKAMNTNVRIFANRHADLIIVLLDREDRDVCPGQWALEIVQMANRTYEDYGVGDFRVVVKNSCYENWLIADTTAFIKMPQRFRLTTGDINRIVPNKADNVDAQSILKNAAQRNSYNKVEDAKRIMAVADPLEIGANSRSFRKFLREIEHPNYRHQSRLPAERV